MNENGTNLIRKAQLDKASRALHFDDLQALVRALHVASTEDPDPTSALNAQELHEQFLKRLRDRL